MLPQLRPVFTNRTSSSDASTLSSGSSTRPGLSHFSSSNTTSTESSYAPVTPFDLDIDMAAAVLGGGQLQGASPGKPGSEYPSYILGLLQALENDPQRLAQSLGSRGNSPSSIPGDATASQTAETQAILASVGRIADKLVKAQQITSSNQHYATSTPTPPALNNETASRLMGIHPDSSNAGDAAHTSNGMHSAVASPRSAISSTADHSSDGFDGQPLSAEKELRLLKAQVQDFARVCKVCDMRRCHQTHCDMAWRPASWPSLTGVAKYRL